MLKPLILSEWKSKTPALQLLSKYLLTCYQCCGFALHKLSHFHHTLKHLDFVSVWQNPVTEQSKKVKEVGAVFLNVKRKKKKLYSHSCPLTVRLTPTAESHPGECCSLSTAVHLTLPISLSLFFVCRTVTWTEASLFSLPLHCPQEMQHSSLCRQQQ